MPPVDKNLLADINQSTTKISDSLATTKESPLRLTSDMLQDQPEMQFPDKPQTTQLDTAESVVRGTGDSMLKQMQSKLETDRQNKEKAYSSSVEDYAKALEDQTGFSGFLAQQEQDRGVQALGDEVARLEGDINTERLARAELKNRLEKKGGGLQGGAEAEYQTFARDSLFRETNAIIQLGVQSGRLSNAQAAAERVAKAYYEQERADIETKKEFVNINKEFFTQAEQRQFNLQYEQVNRELDRQENELLTLQNVQLEAMKTAKERGAPQSVIDAIGKATSKEQVFASAGNYLVKPTPASAPELKNFGTSDAPMWRQYNYQTGQWEEVSGLTNSGLSPQQVSEIDTGIQESQVSIDIIDNLLSNDRGIGAITGQLKTPALSGFFQGGKPAEGAFDVAGLLRYTPVVGNIIGAVQSRNDRDNALTDLTYVYNTEGFQEFIGLKQSGLTFGSLDNAERIAIFAAANRLNSAIEIENDTVSSYRGTDENLKADLELVKKGLKARQDELNAQITLSVDDKQEIINTP